LFGAHGYGQFRYGTTQTIVEQTLEHMVSRYEQILLRAPSCLWTYTGPDLHPSLKDWVGQKVVELPTASKQNTAKVRSLFTQKHLRTISQPSSHPFHSLAMGFESVALAHPMSELFHVVQLYLSGLGGVLYDTLRTKLDTVSHVKAYHVSLAQKGSFFIQLMTQSQVDEDLFDYLQTLFLALKQRAPKENLFAQAKQMHTQAVNQALQDPYELSYDIASRFFSQLPVEELWSRKSQIDPLTPADVVEATCEIMQPDRFAMGTC
jgi:predicted Zn-dependent peptidase